MQRSRILGTGSHLPPRIITNEDLSKMFNTSDEWIVQRTGVRTRRYVDAGWGPAEIGAEAARRALEAAGLAPKDLDFMICATQTPQAEFPGTACFIQKILDNPGIGALDVRDQCTGFLYALSIADVYVRMGMYQRILVVGTEVHSTGLEFSDNGRHVTVLFGDGAGAVVVGPSDSADRGILSVHLHADGRFAETLWVEGPSSKCNPRIGHEMIEQGRHYPRMDGKVVYKEAVTSMVAVVKEALEHNRLTPADIDYFIPHQANMRINEKVSELIGMPREKVNHSIEKYGNCAAASVPIALDEEARAGRFKSGDTLMFATFASGFTWGSAVVNW